MTAVYAASNNAERPVARMEPLRNPGPVPRWFRGFRMSSIRAMGLISAAGVGYNDPIELQKIT
jgi:hypothetical protein